ncbi:plx-1 [Pristionchus pacificus]|nr:plx-1 [Pristionchus pacificus]|eukprot:PDM64129.1 plx-1 [Pristionchus pacificus]
MGNRSIMNWPPWGWPGVIILLIILINPTISFTPIIDDGPKDFHNPNPSFPFEKMVIDPATSRLYVGGVNYLYDLTPDLTVLKKAMTGPKDDSPECYNRNDSCTKARSPTNSHTKSLAIDDRSTHLIECSSLFQGRCRLRMLHNITEWTIESPPMLANDANSTSVIFIGSGPSDLLDDDSSRSSFDSEVSVLYVASTFVGGTRWRDEIPAVASRRLNRYRDYNPFELMNKGLVSPKSAVSIDRKHTEEYKIDYVSGFELGRYAYFATRQQTSLDDEKIQSRLVRVCTGDRNFESYTEVPLECSSGDRQYNLLRDIHVGIAGFGLAKRLGIIGETTPLVYAVFEEGSSDSPRRDVVTSRSALCVYTIDDIERIFRENILDCYQNSHVSTNLPWFANKQCTPTRLNWEQVECGNNVNTRIGGSEPISAEPIIEMDDARVTSVATNTTHGGSTVVFMGTKDGRLVKTVLEDEENSFVYATESISSEPILQDLQFSDRGNFIFALTPNNVIRWPSSNCDHMAQTCSLCMAKRDPHCGWCIRTSSCSLKETCDRSLPMTNSGWLRYDTNVCPNIRSVFPEQVQVSTSDYLNVTMENIGASRKGKLRCVFTFPNGETRQSEPTSATVDDSLRCATPNVEQIPRMASNETSLTSKLSIVEVSSQPLPPLASINFTFFDCRRFSTCTACTSSPFPCDWCLRSNECVSGQETEDRCRGQVFVNGMKRSGSSSRRGPSHCPHIVAPSPLIYQPAGHRRPIAVKAQNIDTAFMHDFKCQFRLPNGNVQKRVATRRNDGNIECDEMVMDDTGRVSIDVVWTARDEPAIPHLLDNTQEISIEVYKCDEIASDCGTCLTLDTSKFACGWCESQQSVQSRCVAPSLCPPRSPFLNSTQLCTTPVIRSFSPKKGPITGNTTMTIRGTNLGRSPVDIKTIMVANVECKVIASEYVAPSTVVCVTGPAQRQNDGRNIQGPIVLKLRPDGLEYSGLSAESFQYVEPAISRVKPSSGPISGGTDLSFNGVDLDAGTEVEVTIGGETCDIKSRSTSTLICRSPPGERIESKPIRVEIDRQHVKMSRGMGDFQYLANPKVSSVLPERSVSAGGIRVDVKGEGFRILQRPKMILFGRGDIKTEGKDCVIRDDSHMECFTPSLPSTEKINDRSIEVGYAFDFDGSTTSRGRLEIFPDPTIESWQEARYYRPTENYLTINGEHLNDAANERDVKVSIGGAECTSTVVASRVITCRPPERKPPLPTGADPEVIVSIAHLKFSAGVLSYSTPGLSSTSISIIAVAIFALLTLLILLLVLYQRKSNSHQRQMKMLKSKMDAIEMRVATECKEAFAELQTSLNAYHADLPLGAPVVPFLEYREYAARVLFPNSGHAHLALRELEVDSSRAKYVEEGLRELHKLLLNKTFLLTMVRTMESNKFFVGKDRVYLGSLLMVVLQEKMAYCTEILKQLLRELIEKTVEKRFQPKILFRRSESVAERMLAAWFSFLMHNYLEESAGKRLFDLYWGIKQQMEKGPQDAITLEARYSLNEEKLLRATFDFREQLVLLSCESGVPQSGMPPGYNTSIGEVPVRVLDCDTITQVKEKCLEARFRSTSFSDRPRTDEVDLEYRHPMHGRLLLQDIDATSRIESGGWKRMNTLAHYQIPPNAVLTMVTRHASLYNLVNPSTASWVGYQSMSLLSEKSSLSIKNSPTVSRANLFGGTNSSNHSKDSDSKVFHLVKPSEHGPSDGQEKMVTEIYLTRLLMMKGTLQKFINDLLESIFSSSRHATLPACVKYMFDFMDSQALEHGITDPEVTHAWKSNALPLRFWVNLIKNPHFVFDVPKPTKIEGCLSVVAQTLMDACSTQDHQLTKDSPSSKLLFAKDMFQYRESVDSYYTEVAKLPTIEENEMAKMLNEESKTRKGQLQVIGCDKVFSSLNEIYKYLEQHKDSIMEALEHSEHAQSYQLPARLQDMMALMESQRAGSDYDSNTLGLGYNSASRLMSRDRL